MPINLPNYLELADDAMKIWRNSEARGHPFSTKDDGSKVTETDQRISMSFDNWRKGLSLPKQCVILDEETYKQPSLEEAQNAQFLILFDPVDGTSNMIAGGNRFTLANLCMLQKTADGGWVNVFSACIRPKQGELFCVIKRSRPQKWHLQENLKTWKEQESTFFPPPEARCMSHVILPSVLHKQHIWNGNHIFRASYGASVDNMIAMTSTNAGMLLFQCKPWDMAIFPMLTAVGLVPYSFTTGEPAQALNLDNFWDASKNTWGSAQDWIVFLPKLLLEDEAKARIATLRDAIHPK